MLPSHSALRIKPYRNWLISSLISGIGTEMTHVAMMWQLYELSQSKYLLGILGLTWFIPRALGAQIAGVLADRHDRRAIIMTSSIILGLLSGLLALTSFTGHITPTLILVFATCMSFADTFNDVPRNSVWPHLVPPSYMTNAITVNSASWNFRKILGPTVAGVLIALVPVGYIYIFDAVSFLAVTIAAWHILKTVRQSYDTTHTSYLKTYLEGVRFVLSTRLLLSTGILDFFIMIFASSTTLLPALVAEVYRGGPVQFGMLQAAISLGAIVPGLYLMYKKHIPHMRETLVVVVGITGISVLVMGLVPSFWAGFACLFLFGLSDEISAIIRNNIRQLITPDHLRARMTSVMMIFFIGGPRLGDFESGVLSSWVGLMPSFLINGTLTIATAIGFGAWSRRVKHEFVQVEQLSKGTSHDH